MQHILKIGLMTTVFSLTLPFASGMPGNEEIIGGQLNREAIFHEAIERDLLTHDRRQLSSEELEADATQVIDPLGVEENERETIHEQATIIEKGNELDEIPQISWWENFKARIRRYTSFEPFDYVRYLCIRGLSFCYLYDWTDPMINAGRFLTDDMSNHHRNRIITAIASNINEDDIDEFEAFVRRFLPPNTKGWEQVGFIEALAKVNISNREGFEAYTRQFFTEDMDGYEISSIVSGIARYIFPYETELFLAFVNQFIKPGMSGNERANIINGLAHNILPNDRTAFKRFVDHFISDDMNDSSHAHIIYALEGIPPNHRKNFETYARSFL